MASSKAICSVDGCDKTVRSSKDFCHAHYMRWRRHGDPLGGRTGKGAAAKYLQEVVLTYVGDKCLLWPFGGARYGKTSMGGKDLTIHRYVCEMMNGTPPSPDHEAAHNCGNARCVSRWHIAWKTATENQADRVEHGTDVRGEKSPNAKLTSSQVAHIRELAGSLRQQDIAEQYGVSQSLIHLIVARKAWAHE